MTTETRRSTVRVLAAVAMTVTVAAGVAGCADADDAAPEHRVFELGKDRRALVVDVDDSPLELVATGRRDVRVTRWFDGLAYGGSAGARWTFEDGTLSLGPRCAGPASCDIRHRVEVPHGVAVRVVGDNGDVTAGGFRAALAVEVDNGKVRVRNVTGPLELSGDNGSVEATDVRSREVVAETDNGGLKLALTGVPGSVEARSHNGSVTVELPRAAYRVDAGADNGSVRVEVPRDPHGERTVAAHSSNGNVTVRTAG
ncbi:DUF4097 family beta strand repeat protein [Streptomyces sp. TRM43335]|uniref:DUF4097 family beta strand repeat protein n=1 Tax=Streptomyces taklimakanensis TaxID=2569853 RepID=A0A6G2B9D3_9ACTN|nr:DUF4097 family beta strand repeat-containing protein [Streptomyces taklimakanensis]MTE18867.1 DUF4097 family beta strand repeat protein [Streptomyces taklimakanensis]